MLLMLTSKLLYLGMLKMSIKFDRLEILGKSALNREQNSKASENGTVYGIKNSSAGLCLKAELLQTFKNFYLGQSYSWQVS